MVIFLCTWLAAHISGLDEACLTGDRLRLDRPPATAIPRFLTPEGYAFLLSD
jgi:hypothetical protein